ncbi:expressed unknown protein [Seminavis robusta]|uniref:Uncharacterized protein n=1 Tax=Seminavis robusta TaxID=568900 RepID=A0A9N8HV01_9STRA|nr:expressed unknown protein [Seminavis robusta]|eukprot:Sro1719_g293450.1 n/a (517) ;mRNA; f:20740-22290
MCATTLKQEMKDHGPDRCKQRTLRSSIGKSLRKLISPTSSSTSQATVNVSAKTLGSSNDWMATVPPELTDISSSMRSGMSDVSSSSSSSSAAVCKDFSRFSSSTKDELNVSSSTNATSRTRFSFSTARASKNSMDISSGTQKTRRRVNKRAILKPRGKPPVPRRVSFCIRVENVPKVEAKTKKDNAASVELSLPLWTSSLPPFSTCAMIVGLIALFGCSLPSWESIDQVATVETFSRTNFDGTPRAVIVMGRLILAAVMLGNAASVFLYGQWYADTDYFPDSKLTVAKRIPFQGALTKGGTLGSGLKCIATFTLWCWIVEGSAFFLAGMIPLVHWVAPNIIISPYTLRTALILWETAAPVSILVSAVVKYALWPMAQRHGENIKLLKATGALLQHNLNTVAALIEVGLLGGLPVCWSHFAIPPLYGLAYLLFSYSMMYSWAPVRKGPQFFYPFFDTTLGAGTTSLLLIALLAVLLVSFVFFCGAATLLTGGAEIPVEAVPFAAIFLIVMTVCRVQD